MFWAAQKQFFSETLGNSYTHPTCFVRFILLANYKDSSSKTADSIEQYNNYWEELTEDPDFRYAMGKASPYALKDSDGFQYSLSQDVHSIGIKIRVKDLDQRASRKPIAFSPWVRRAIFHARKITLCYLQRV